MRIEAYAAPSKGALLAPFAYEPAELGPHDVDLAISHCGLCHSDLHLLDDDWKLGAYPLVPGHEIIGTVVQAGALSHLRPGQRAGVGWQRGACLACDLCLAGHENLCAAQEATCVGHHGGMARRIRTDGRFAFAIPEGLDSAAAAPLLCGGVTVFAPLRRHGVDRRSSVGVIGIGGLGHLALLLLRAMGCEITAFSSTADKRAEALAMGAHDFASSTDAREIRRHAGRFDLLLSTVAARLDWITFLQTLRPRGTLCLLGAPPGLLQLPAATLLTGQRSIAGSVIGGRPVIAELLQFAALHGIAPRLELRPLSQVNHALDRLRNNRVRYRMVLEGS